MDWRQNWLVGIYCSIGWVLLSFLLLQSTGLRNGNPLVPLVDWRHSTKMVEWSLCWTKGKTLVDIILSLWNDHGDSALLEVTMIVKVGNSTMWTTHQL